jgi:galactokinase
MAIAPSTRSDGSVHLQNLDPHYAPAILVPQRGSSAEAWELPINRSKLTWDGYVKAGYLGVLNKLLSEPVAAPKAVDILVSGTIPPGSGISSSAALVVASTLSFLIINDKLDEMNKRSVVEMAMENERRVGVNSGGCVAYLWGASCYSYPRP